jgi:16S rRNA (uracil1498-N3)-methyltransferase
MTRRRFFVPVGRLRDGVARLSSDQIHHLRDVLRLRPGDQVEVFDGEGTGYLGRVEAVGSELVVGSLQKVEAATESPVQVVLALALTKPDRFAWALQKTTELGVHEIVPLQARFSSVRLGEDKLHASMERWHRIVQEASKQCGRVSIPRIHQARQALDFLTGGKFPNSATLLFFHEKAPASWGRSFAGTDRLVVCIGPEGGWEQAEVEAADRAGYQILSLGPRILRTETAAVAALAILQFQCGDLGTYERGETA